MILRYLDTHPDHRHLWQNLDPTFQAMVPAITDPAAYEQALFDYLHHQLTTYTGSAPVLLVWHVHEERFSQQRPWELTQDLWRSWPAHERIYCVLVSGGGAVAHAALLQQEAFSTQHFYALPEPLPLAIEPAFYQRWQRFLQDFKTSGQANWDLLTPQKTHSAQVLDRWRSWRHDLLLCLKDWPSRQSRAQAHWQQLPPELSGYLSAAWHSEIQQWLFQSSPQAIDRTQIESLLSEATATLTPLMIQTELSYAGLEAQGWSREQAQRLLRHWEHLRQQWQVFQSQHRELTELPEDLAQLLTDLYQRLPDIQQASQVQALAQSVRQLASRLASQDPPSPVRQVLHNGVEQSLYYVAAELARWEAALAALWRPLCSGLEALSRWIQDWPEPQQAATAELRRSSASGHDKVNLLIVEDHPLWRQDIPEICQQVIADLGCGARIRSLQCVHDLAQARQVLDSINHHQAALLVILDLSFPASPGQPAAREAGLELLRELTNYHQQATVIVFSTPRWLLQDQRMVQACGIPDADFVLKSEAHDLPGVISGWLERLLYQPLAYSLEIQRDLQADTGQVILNQVPVKLERTVFQFLYALADLRQHTGRRVGVSAETLVHHVEALFSRFVRPESLQEWSEQASETYQSLDERLNLVLQSLPMQDQAYHTSLRNRLLQQARIWLQDPTQELCSGLKQDQELLDLIIARYESLASLKPLSNQKERYLRFFVPQTEQSASSATLGTYVSDQIYQLRQHFHEQLQAAGQVIRVHDLIISTQTDGYGTRYALSPLVTIQISDLKPSQTASRPLCVWLIENDPLYIQDFQQVIGAYGAQSVLLPHLQAVREILTSGPLPRSGPDLILLDLHIPEDAQAYAQDPLSGQERFGLYALNEIQMHYPDVRTLVVSAFSDRDDLRVLARKLNHLNQVDFVAKGGASADDWLALFHRQFQRFLNQFDSPLDQMPIPPCVVELVSYEALPKAQLKLHINGSAVLYQGIQAQCMKLLLQYHGQWVPPEVMVREVYQVDPDLVDLREYDEKIKQLRKQLRDKIHVSWFEQHVPKKAIQASVLSSQRFGGTRLNVHQVVDPQGLLRLSS